MKNTITFKMLTHDNDIEYVTFTPAEYIEVFEEDIDYITYYMDDSESFDQTLADMYGRNKSFTLEDFVKRYLEVAPNGINVDMVE